MGKNSCNQKGNFSGRSFKENISLTTGLEQETSFYYSTLSFGVSGIYSSFVFSHLLFSSQPTQCGSVTTISNYIAQQQNNLLGIMYLVVYSGLLQQNIRKFILFILVFLEP